MSITDELREYVGNFYLFRYKDVREELNDIADRIDIAHKHAIGYVDDRDPETMAENGWIRLPVDAEGEVIHIGDVMEVISSKQRAKACYMQTGPSGTWAVGLTQACHWYDTESLRHHATTVEDVLREFVERLDEIGSEDDCVGEVGQECRACIRRDIAAAYAEYAAKLRLAGEE